MATISGESGGVAGSLQPVEARLVSRLHRHHSLVPLVLLILPFIIGPQIPAYGLAGDVIGLTCLALTVHLGLRLLYHEPRLPSVRSYLAVLLLLSAYSAIAVALNAEYDWYYVARALRTLLNFTGGIELVLLYFDRYGDRAAEYLVKHICAAITFHGLVMVGEFLRPSFRAAVYAITRPNIAPDNLPYRMAGLTNGAGAGGSVLQFMGIMIAPGAWLFARTTIGKSAALASVAVNLAACLLTGRTGIYFTLVFLPIEILLLWRVKRRNSTSGVRRQSKRIGRSVIGVGVVVAVLWLAVPPLVEYIGSHGLAGYLLRAYSRAAESYFAYQDTGRVHERTVSYIFSNMIFVPDQAAILFFGNARYFHETVRSDIGYVKELYGLGLLGTFTVLSFYWLTIRSAWRARALTPIISVLSIMTTMMLVVAETKEVFLLSRFYFSVTTLLAVAICMQSSVSSRQGDTLAGLT